MAPDAAAHSAAAKATPGSAAAAAPTAEARLRAPLMFDVKRISNDPLQDLSKIRSGAARVQATPRRWLARRAAVKRSGGE